MAREMMMEMMVKDLPETEEMSPYQEYQYLTKVAPRWRSNIELDLTVPNNNNSTTNNGEEDDDDGMVMTTTTTSTRRCWDEIPTDILLKILSGMPMRRLVRYRGVSKTWFHTITHHMDPNLLSANQEPGFIVIHNSRANSTSRLSFNVTQGGVKPKSIDYAPFEILLSNHSSFESSCNGLICLKQYSSSECISSSSSATAKYRILVCNPYLLEATTLPNIINNSNSDSSSSSSFPPGKQHRDEQNRPFNFKENHGLGFSSSTNQYKVVRVTWFNEDHVDMMHHVSYRKNKQDGSTTMITHLRQPENVKILTLGTSTNSWRDVSSVPPLPIYGASVYANGSLHWKVDTRNVNIRYLFTDFCIISFDIGKEEFHVISQPPYARLYSDSENLDLINWRGSLAMVKYGARLLDIWIPQLNNNKNKQQQWIREYTIEHGEDLKMTKVIGLWEHGEILGHFRDSFNLISYDPKTSKKRRIQVRSGFYPMKACSHEVQGHTGSLVSLKAYGCKTWRTAPGLICSNLYDRDNALFSKEEGIDPTTVQLITEYISDPVLGCITYI